MFLLVFSFCCTAVVASANSSFELDLTSTSSTIHEGYTKTLTLTCTFTPAPGTEFSLVTSLIVSRERSDQNVSSPGYLEIATLTAVHTDQVVVTDSLSAHVTGRLTTGQRSFITFQWKYPSREVEGRYKCQVNGMNNLGHPVVTSATTVISERPMDLEIVLSKVKTLEVNQDDLISRLDAAQTELQQRREKDNETRTAFAQSIYNFRGHQYLLSRPYPWNVPVADVMCRTLGGYLVEVNDEEEFQFVQQVLEDSQWTGYTLYGGTDYGHQGHWTYLSSGQPAFLKWNTGSPSNRANDKYLYSHKTLGWRMSDDVAVYTSEVIFLCEIN